MSLALLALAGAQSLPVQADLTPEPVGRWWFWPETTLPLRAANYPGPRPAYPRTDFAPIDAETHPLLLHGEAPTERIARLLAPDQLRRHAFSVEFWLIDHVRPIWKPPPTCTASRTCASATCSANSAFTLARSVQATLPNGSSISSPSLKKASSSMTISTFRPGPALIIPPRPASVSFGKPTGRPRRNSTMAGRSLQLRRSNARWKCVAHHHPAYTSDEDDYGDTWRGGSQLGDANVRGIVPLYEKHSVDIVFFGHLHTYERSWPIAEGRVDLDRGVRYIQTGGAGGNLEDFTPTRNWFTAKLYRGHHYCLLNVFGGHLSFQMFDVEGRLRDAFELNK